ncbi:MAG: YfhO family protein, partial [Rubrobacteraceae bacterium]
DPRKTALLEGSLPRLSIPEDPSNDRASVTDYENDRIQVRTSTDAAGLLVLSEVYYPAWKAYVDGEPVPVRRADQLLRAVPIPTGDHTVEMRYESGWLRAGMAISSVTVLLLVALTVAAAVRQRRRP